MKNKHAKALGALGGKARAAKLTEPERKAIASKAGNTPCSPGKTRGRPLTRYRYLRQTEIIQKGDQKLIHREWFSCPEYHGCPVGIDDAALCVFRRPITKTQKGK